MALRGVAALSPSPLRSVCAGDLLSAGSVGGDLIFGGGYFTATDISEQLPASSRGGEGDDGHEEEGVLVILQHDTCPHWVGF